MGHIGGIALTTSAMFLVVVAVMLNNPALFYMSTAMIATIGASRLQAWLSVRGLRFERTAPDVVRAGELVTIEITVWSERRIRRPLVTVMDNLPSRILAADLTPSLPIAPAFDIPVRTQYRFRPLKRGVYRWSGLRVAGTDALGLVTMERVYPTDPVEMVVLPVPVPVAIDMPAASAWGLSSSEGNRGKGSGLEPRGTREYTPGDPLRHIHWRSSARAGTLLVKEFEAGIQASFVYLLQTTTGTEVGKGARTTLELMCGHAAHISQQLLRTGATVAFPSVEEQPSIEGADRATQILHILARVESNRTESIAEDLRRFVGRAESGVTALVAISVGDPALPDAIRSVSGSGTQVVVLIYDADAFSTGRSRLRTAADPHYARELQSAGARTIRMPAEGLIS